MDIKEEHCVQYKSLSILLSWADHFCLYVCLSLFDQTLKAETLESFLELDIRSFYKKVSGNPNSAILTHNKLSFT
jgi:hypothetical protein